MILSSDGNGGAVDRPFPLARAAVTAPLEPPAARPVYPAIVHPDAAVEAPEHTWHLSGGVVNGQVQFTINGQAAFAPDDHDGHGGHQHATLQTFQRGQPVRIKLTSDVSPVHPFHIHGQFFQILERNGQPADEPGLRDTVEVRGRGSVTILSYFENPGQWMVHCHISEHGENGMMADIMVED